MKKYLLLMILSTPLFALSQATATARGGGGPGLTSYTNGFKEVFSKGNTYIIIKFWNEAEPLTDKEKKDFSNVRQQLAGKGVTAIEYNWKTKEDIEALFKKHEVPAEVSTENGMYIKSGEILISSTSTKALFIIENKKAKKVCIGNNCENYFLKTFFEIEDI